MIKRPRILEEIKNEDNMRRIKRKERRIKRG